MGSDLPATRRQEDGSGVAIADARRAWGEAAGRILRDVAGSYNRSITYTELSVQVQAETGIVTSQLMRYWIGKVLFIVAQDCGDRGEPILTALCVRSDGTVGDGYGEAILRTRGVVPSDLEMHAASERLDCYRRFGADLPPDGGQPTLTEAVAALRRRSASSSRQASGRERTTCPTCHMRMPLSGPCGTCD